LISSIAKREASNKLCPLKDTKGHSFGKFNCQGCVTLINSATLAGRDLLIIETRFSGCKSYVVEAMGSKTPGLLCVEVEVSTDPEIKVYHSN
jgi:hypothetical protein